MARTKLIDGVVIDLTIEEEAELDAAAVALLNVEPTIDERNAIIKAQLVALDMRRIRPLAEGDGD